MTSRGHDWITGAPKIRGQISGRGRIMNMPGLDVVCSRVDVVSLVGGSVIPVVSTVCVPVLSTSVVVVVVVVALGQIGQVPSKAST